MAGPLIVLYEVGIVAAALFGKKKPPTQAAEPAG
jgi:Sec-independent protein secretion pathway component TatC